MISRRAVLANYMGNITAVVAPILALPWYLDIFGTKLFGLVGMILMLQNLLSLFDVGMGQALTSEFAAKWAVGERKSAAATLFNFERLYWLFGLSVWAFVCVLAWPISAHWIQLDGLPASSGWLAVAGAGAIFAAQFPGTMYRALLIGAEAQVGFNAVAIVGVIARQLGCVLMLLVWPSLTTYLLWHASLALLETLARGAYAWHVLGVPRADQRWDAAGVRKLGKWVAGMAAAAWIGSLTTFMDRIVLSGMASVEQFGFYAIAASSAAGVLQLVYPVIHAAWPRAVAWRDDAARLYALNRRLTGVVTILVLVGGAGFVAIGEWVLTLWLRNPQAVAAVYPLLQILLLGTALNAFYSVGYLNWLAHGRTRRVLQVNLLSMLLAAAVLPLSIHAFGTAGAAAGWLIISFVGLVFSLEWVWRKPVAATVGGTS